MNREINKLKKNIAEKDEENHRTKDELKLFRNQGKKAGKDNKLYLILTFVLQNL